MPIHKHKIKHKKRSHIISRKWPLFVILALGLIFIVLFNRQVENDNAQYAQIELTPSTITPKFECLGACPTQRAVDISINNTCINGICTTTTNGGEEMLDEEPMEEEPMEEEPMEEEPMGEEAMPAGESASSSNVCKPKKKLQKAKKKKKKLKKKMKKAKKAKKKKLKKKIKKMKKKIKKLKKKVKNKC